MVTPSRIARAIAAAPYWVSSNSAPVDGYLRRLNARGQKRVDNQLLDFGNALARDVVGVAPLFPLPAMIAGKHVDRAEAEHREKPRTLLFFAACFQPRRRPLGRLTSSASARRPVDFVYLLPAYPAPTASLAKMRISRHFVRAAARWRRRWPLARAWACARNLSASPAPDDNAKQVRRELADRGVDLTDVVIRDVSNQYAVILVDEHSGERIVLWDRDNKLTLRERELPPDVIASTRVIHVDDVDQEASIRAATLARSTGTIVTSDIDRINERTTELAKAVTIPIFAEHVPSTITGINDPADALRALRNDVRRVCCASPLASAGRWRSTATN
jgi:hypothetical protein